jgi:hypothetical protein
VFTDVDAIEAEFVGKLCLLDDVADYLTGTVWGAIKTYGHVTKGVEAELNFCWIDCVHEISLCACFGFV